MSSSQIYSFTKAPEVGSFVFSPTSGPILNEKQKEFLTGFKNASDNYSYLSGFSKPRIQDIREGERDGVVRLHRRDINIFRFQPPHSVLIKYGIASGYKRFARKEHEASLDEEGFSTLDESVFGLPLTSGLELYTYVLSKTNTVDGFDFWLEVLALGYRNLCTTQGMMDWLSAWSLYAKKLGSAFLVDWKMFVDPNFWGHRYRDVNWFKGSQAQSAREWVVDSTPIEQAEHYFLFLQQFRYQVKRYFDTKLRQVDAEKLPTMEEFLKDPISWASSGTARASDLQFKRHKNMRNTKLNFALEDYNELLKAMLSTTSEVLRINDKEEAGKVRLFISASIESFLKMAFVSRYLDAALKGDAEQSVFWDGEEKLLSYQKIIDGLKDSINVPLDLDAFDQKAASFDMIVIVFEGIIEAVSLRLGTDSEYTKIAKLILEQYLSGPVALLPSGEKIKVLKGMMSGWFWTAFMDSIISWCIAQIIAPAAIKVVTQGDDILLQLASLDDLWQMWALVKMYGIAVNEKKFYVSYRKRLRNEFLRTSLEVDGLFGYPARTLGSILWRKPWLEEPQDRRVRIESAITSWKRCCNRLAIRSWPDWMFLDINGIWPMLPEVVLYTHRVLGGFGLGDRRQFLIKWEEEIEYGRVPKKMLNRGLVKEFPYEWKEANFIKAKRNVKFKIIELASMPQAVSAKVYSWSKILLAPKNYRSLTTKTFITEFYSSRKLWDKLALELYLPESPVFRLRQVLSRSVWLDVVLNREFYTTNVDLVYSDTLLGVVNRKMETIIRYFVLSGKCRNRTAVEQKVMDSGMTRSALLVDLTRGLKCRD
jgi:hypothetical protein